VVGRRAYLEAGSGRHKTELIRMPAGFATPGMRRKARKS